MRQHRSGDAEQAEHVGAEQLAGLRGAGLLDRAEQAVAGIVDQDIDAAELLHRLARGLVGLGLAGDVEPRRQQALMCAKARGDGVGIAGGRNHRIARPSSAASAIRAPKPREAPVMNQTRMILPFPFWPAAFAEA